MIVDDIRAFIPSRDYELSLKFYKALGFKGEHVSNDLTLFVNGDCFFYLQRFYQEEFANNLMLQLSVVDIEEAWQLLIALEHFEIKFNPIKSEPWGKVIYL